MAGLPVRLIRNSKMPKQAENYFHDVLIPSFYRPTIELYLISADFGVHVIRKHSSLNYGISANELATFRK
jgi:hypothetical protein